MIDPQMVCGSVQRTAVHPGPYRVLGVSAGVPRMEHQARGEDRHLLRAFLPVVARAIRP